MNKLSIALLIGALLCICTPAYSEFSDDQPTVLITGANRGLGLEFAKQYAARDWNVIATTRSPARSDDLNALAAERSNVIVEQLDVTDHARIDELAEKYEARPIDVLLNNAGLTPKYASAELGLADVNFQTVRDSFEVNAIGPLKMCQAFMPHVIASKQKKIVVSASTLASFEDGLQRSMGYAYRGSKVAVNMFMFTIAFEAAKNDVIVSMLFPGLINNNPNVQDPSRITPLAGVMNMISVIDTLTAEDNGKFIDTQDRSQIPW